MADSSKHTWSFKPVKDEPIDDASLLGIDRVISTLYGFLTSESIISPIVISVNGEWGSGKTSLTMTLNKKLQGSGIKTVFFDAWKYEYSDPAAALVWVTATQLTLGKKELKVRAKELGKLALDVFTRKTIDIPLSEVENHFRSSVQAVNTLTGDLSKMVKEGLGSDQKVVVFIDDLDRCSLDNVIQVLEAIKLFLNIPNFIFVMAIDIDKIKLAWSAKYGLDKSLEREGLRYLEKIIQLQIGLPQPSRAEVEAYISSLFPSMPKKIIELLALSQVDNPRRIKRLLNLIALRCNIEGEKVGKVEAALLWTVLEAMRWSYSTSGNIAYFYESYVNRYGAAGFYDLLFEIANTNVDDFQKRYTSDEKFKGISELHSNPLTMHRYIQLVSELIKGIDKQKMLVSLKEVVSFSNERRSEY